MESREYPIEKNYRKAVVILADGTIFHGSSLVNGTAFGEICFNTGATGYQEIFTDPSYFGQIVVMSTPHIGNYGSSSIDLESQSTKISGLVCKRFSTSYSRPAADGSLLEFLQKNKLFMVSDVDTRALVSYIRDNGSMNAVISTEVDQIAELKKKLSGFADMNGLELASKVSTKEPYYFGNENSKYKVAAIDLGMKQNILRSLAERDVYVKVFPYNATFEEINAWNPDGYFISNGPGDPEPLKEVQRVTRQLIDTNKPLFGICLGHQIIALSLGVGTYKMHNGHRGINHPVKNLLTGKGEITSQNHGFAIDREQAERHPDIEITHVHLNDNTVAGIRLKNKKCFSVQYHPEASPGPKDASYLFDNYVELLIKK